MEFYEKLKQLRSEKGISQQELADQVYVSRSAVAKWETGIGLPSKESLQLLCDYFGKKPEDLLETEAQKNVNKNRKIRKYRLMVLIVGIAAILFLAGTIFGVVYCIYDYNHFTPDVYPYQKPSAFSIDKKIAQFCTAKREDYLLNENGHYQLTIWPDSIPHGPIVQEVLPVLEYKNEYDIVRLIDPKDMKILRVYYGFLNNDYSPYDSDPEKQGEQLVFYDVDNFNQETGKIQVHFADLPCNAIVLMVDCKFSDTINQYAYLIYR